MRSAASALVLNAIPIERTRVSRRPADDAAALIDDGWSLVIFPEGGRSPDGWGQPFRGGAAYLALRCKVPVVPVHLEGTGRILRKGKRRPARSATRLTFGEPLWPTEGEDSRRFAARIERAVAALADEAAHRLVLGPACAPTAPRRRRCRARRRPRGGGRGPSVTAARSAAARRNAAGPISTALTRRS